MAKTLASRGRQLQCPKCRAPAGQRCWNLYRHRPGGELRPESERAEFMRRNKPTSRSYNKHCHTERYHALVQTETT